MLSFKPSFSLSSFTLIKRLFSSSLLSTITVVSSGYLRSLIFLLAILIMACVSSSPSFRIMYFKYKLNKQRNNIQPLCTPFPICNVGDLGSIPGSGRSPGEGNGNPLQYSCLENPTDGGAWWATVTKSRT